MYAYRGKELQTGHRDSGWQNQHTVANTAVLTAGFYYTGTPNTALYINNNNDTQALGTDHEGYSSVWPICTSCMKGAELLSITFKTQSPIYLLTCSLPRPTFVFFLFFFQHM